jgi:hypothetical protein
VITNGSPKRSFPRMALNDANENDELVLYTSSGATYNIVMKRLGDAYKSLFWRASTMLWLTQSPVPSIVEIVTAFRRSVNWNDDTPVIGVHVRHGDKGTEVDRLHETQEYIERALRVRSKQSAFRTMFLASDDPKVIEQAQQHAAQNGFRLIYREELRTNDAVHALLTKGQLNALEQGTTALVNILLLSMCDELIGTFSSSFFKLAYELRYAKTGSTVAQSLDLSAWRP